MVNDGSALKLVLPDGRLPESRAANSRDPEVLRSRMRDLEQLCAEVYVAAVEIGLPQPLLNRLWTVAAQGSSPHAYAVDMQPAAAEKAAGDSTPVAIPDVRLTDHPSSVPDGRTKPAQAELQPLALRRRVMVVDDDPMMMEVLVRILQRENYDLMTASSGHEALGLAAAEAEPIDLLITDYAMPAMKGHELADRMRERYPAVRVLYQTGFSDMLFENRAELEDNAAFLEKPFTARGLREAARFILFGAINPPATPAT